MVNELENLSAVFVVLFIFVYFLLLDLDRFLVNLDVISLGVFLKGWRVVSVLSAGHSLRSHSNQSWLSVS